MNDVKGYTGLLLAWSRELRLGGALFVARDPRHRDIVKDSKRRPRHILAVIDEDADADGGGCAEGTREFLRRLRTENVDVNMRGQKCQERQSNVVGEINGTAGTAPGSGSGTGTAGLELVNLDGAGGPHGHVPAVRAWLRGKRQKDAEEIIKRFGDHLGVKEK